MSGTKKWHRTDLLDVPTSGLLWRTLLLLSALVILQLGVSSLAHAESFYYYGKNNSTCWQTGTPAAPTEACDSVGASSFPAAHICGREPSVPMCN